MTADLIANALGLALLIALTALFWKLATPRDDE